MKLKFTVETLLPAILLAAFATACGSSSSLVAVDPTEVGGDVAVSLEVEPESNEDEKNANYGSEDPGLELIDDFESIVGGTPANISQYPFMVGLVNLSDDGTRFTSFCGGTLIRPNWVLTAAHCFVDDNGRPINRNNLAVFEGSADLTRSPDIRVDQVRIFPGFSTNGNVFNNDVALLRLSRNSTRPTVAIANSSSIFAPGQTATTIGWGRTRNGDPNSSSIRQLQQVDVRIQRDLICSRLYPDTYVERNMICAGDLDTNRSVCNGDSGGPLLVRRNNNWVQIGITSFGVRDGCGVFPAGYTEALTYLNWINQQIGGSQTPPPPPPVQTPTQPQIGFGSITTQLSSSAPDNPTRPGRRFQDFRLGVPSGNRVQIDLRSSDFDAYLQLVDANTGRVIAFNDDFGGSTNSRITFTVESGRSYTIRVTTFAANEFGSYTLSSQRVF